MLAFICRNLGAQGFSRYEVTVHIAERIRELGYRFDSSWRHGDTPQKAAAYECCYTVAANDIADNPQMVDFWKPFICEYLA